MGLFNAKYLFTQGKLARLPQQPTQQEEQGLSGIDLRGEQGASSQSQPEVEEPQAEERMKPQNVQYPNAYQGKTLESIENGRQAVNAQQNVPANDNQPEQPTEQPTNALDDALAERDKIYGEQIKSFEDLLKYYKHETPEEKARRERRERIERSATAAIDLAGALGNLGASMSKDGRSVKWNGTSKAVKEEQEQQRKLREQDNAKAIELQKSIQALRKARAEGKLTAAQAAEALKLKREALANDNFKFKMNFDQKERHHADEMQNKANEQQTRKNIAEANRKAQLNIANIRAATKKSGSSDNLINLDIGNDENLKISSAKLNSSALKGQLINLIPKDFIETYSAETGISLHPDINDDASGNDAWNLIFGYLYANDRDANDSSAKERVRKILRKQQNGQEDEGAKPKKREQTEIPSADEDLVQQHMNVNGAYGYQSGTGSRKPVFQF